MTVSPKAKRLVTAVLHRSYWSGVADNDPLVEKDDRDDAESQRAAAESGLLAYIGKLEAENAQLLKFAGKAIEEAGTPDACDWGGGDLEQAMLDCGLIRQELRATPCGEDCPCAEYHGSDEQVQCNVYTDLAERARAAASPSKEPAQP